MPTVIERLRDIPDGYDRVSLKEYADLVELHWVTVHRQIKAKTFPERLQQLSRKYPYYILLPLDRLTRLRSAKKRRNIV